MKILTWYIGFRFDATDTHSTIILNWMHMFLRTVVVEVIYLSLLVLKLWLHDLLSPSQLLQYWLKERTWKGLNWSYSLQHSSGNETTHSETFNLSLNKIRGTYYGFAWLSLVRGRSLTNNRKSLVEVIPIKTST